MQAVAVAAHFRFSVEAAPPSRRERRELSSERTSLISARPPGLVDVLDRILDKGLVIAGDVKVSLANVELLTLQIRLLICSIDKAEQIGLNWWRYDSNLTTRAERAETENLELRERLAALEREIRRLDAAPAAAAPTAQTAAAPRKSAAGKRAAPPPARKGRNRSP